MAVNDPGLLPGNWLSHVNQGFESSSGWSWTAGNSNTTLALSSVKAFAGSQSMQMTATAAGTLSAASPSMLVGDNMSFVVSAYMYSTASGDSLTMAIKWLDGSGNQVAFDVSPVVSSIASTWTPVPFACAVPAGAVTFQAWARDASAVAGQSVYVDLVYVSASKTQVLVDWINPAIGQNATAGSAWTDITPWVRLDQPLNITRGRQDNISQVQPGNANFTIENNSGWFTPRKTGSPWKANLGRRIRVLRADETGNWWTRFDGQISEFNAQPSINGQENLVSVNCSDVLAFLNRQPDLSCWTVELCKSFQPDLQYILDEADNGPATQVSDSSGNNGPSLVPAVYTGIQYSPSEPSNLSAVVSGCSITYQGGTSPVEAATEPTTYNGAYALNTSPIQSPLPSAYFGGSCNGSSSNFAATGGSAQLNGALPFPLRATSGSAWTVLGWVTPDVTISNYQYIDYCMAAICLGNDRSTSTLHVGALPLKSGGGGYYYIQYYNSFLVRGQSITAQKNIQLSSWQYNEPIMVAMVCSGRTVTMYLSGNVYGTGPTTMTSATITLPNNLEFNYLSIGGMLGGGQGWLGNISNVCVYKSLAMNESTINYLGTIGAQGYFNDNIGTSASDAINRFTDIPPYWTGTFDDCSMVQDYYDISGQNVMSALQQLAGMAHAEYFVDASGKLNLQGRDRRMGALAPLVLPEGSYTADIQPRWTDQGLINYEVLGSAERTSGTTVIEQNDDSIAEFGLYPNGSVQSPVTAPYDVVGETVFARQTANPGTTRFEPSLSLSQINDAAAWEVNTMGRRGMTLAAVTLDVFSNTPGSSEYVAPSALYGREIGQLIQLSENLPWWPDEANASILYIEGVTESYSTTTGTVQFYASPSSEWLAWQPGSPISGQLDSTALIGIGLGAYPGEPELVHTPLPVTTFSNTMNLEDSGYNGFVGASDMRSLTSNLDLLVNPPIAFMQQNLTPQQFASGTASQIIWDTSTIDTAQGVGYYGTADYVVQLEGWYEVYLTFTLNHSTLGQVTCYIGHNQNGTVRVIAPSSIDHVGTSNLQTCLTTSAVLYCHAGDALSGWGLHDNGSAVGASTNNGGSTMSILYLGYGSARN